MSSGFSNLVLAFALSALGAYAGGCLYISVVEVPALRAVPVQEYANAFKLILPRAGILMLPLLISAAVCATLYWYGQARFNALVVIAVVLIGLTVVATFVGNVPINRQLLSDNLNDLERWPALTRQWELWHLSRTIFSCAAFSLLALTAATRA
jgi:uncharacterized membrane protein